MLSNDPISPPGSRRTGSDEGIARSGQSRQEFAGPALTLAAEPPPASEPGRHSEWPYYAVLVAAVLASRWPLIANREGEPDTGLFVEGVWRWLSYGPRVAEIYSKNLSPLYYWGLAALARWRHIPPARFPWTMNMLSLAAALAAGPLLYAIARRWLGPAMSLASALLVLFSPSFWWLGIEPHPQGIAITGFLATVFFFLRAWRLAPVEAASTPLPAWPDARWSLAAAAALTATLLLRADHVLLLAVFPALLLAHEMRAGRLRPRWWRERLWWERMAAVALPLAAAGLTFAWLRIHMLRQSFAATQAYSEQQTAGYMYYGFLQVLRSRAYILKQVLPVALAPGLLAFLFAVAGTGLGARRLGRAWWGPWALLIASWSAIGYVFWLLVLGNNIRHVTLLILPLIWAACSACERLISPRRAVALLAAVLVLDPLVVPASSNVTLYASANVPASARMLWQRQKEMHAALERLLVSSRRPPSESARLDPAQYRIPGCFLGSYTTPYMLSFLLMRQNRLDVDDTAPLGTQPIAMRVGPGWSDVMVAGAGNVSWIRFYEMYSEEEYQKLRPRCDAAASFEYDGQGYHQRYLGKEWHVPLEKVWYPPHPPKRKAALNPAPAK